MGKSLTHGFQILRFITLFVFFAVSFFSITKAYAYVSPGVPQGYVSDFAHMFQKETVNALDARLKDFEQQSTVQIAVVTIPSVGDDYIENYAAKLFEEWGIGQKGKNNGILLLISRDDRQIKIEVGYGLEGSLTDSDVALKLIQGTLVPAFRSGEYDIGVLKAVDQIIEQAQGDSEGASVAQSKVRITQDEIGAIFFFGIIVLQWLAAILSRSRSWWLGGVLGGGFGVGLTVFHVFGINLLLGAALSALFTFLGLLFDYIVSTTYQQAVGKGLPAPWWSGGGGSNGWSTSTWNSASSFSGFSGGRSGGGGASGAW